MFFTNSFMPISISPSRKMYLSILCIENFAENAEKCFAANSDICFFLFWDNRKCEYSNEHVIYCKARASMECKLCFVFSLCEELFIDFMFLWTVKCIQL